MVLSKEQNHRERLVSWGGLIDAGVEPSDSDRQNFTCRNGFVYSIGYRCKRLIYQKDKTIEVECAILKSNLNGLPLFQCSFTIPESQEMKTITALTPTVVANKTVSELCGSNKHRWSGFEFFGLRRNDVKDSIEKNVKNEVKIGWLGVKSFGIPIISDERYLYTAGSTSFRLQPGYEAIRTVSFGNKERFSINCMIKQTDTGPMFECVSENGQSFTAPKPTVAMNGLFELLNIAKTRNRSGYEFYGFNRSEVLKVLKAPITEYSSTKEKSTSCPPELKKLHAICERNSGVKTSELLHKRSKIARNTAIHEAIKLISVDDIENYVSYLCDNYPEILDIAIEKNDVYKYHLQETMFDGVSQPVTISEHETANLLMGKFSLSQRAYKNLKKILKSQNVTLPRYENVIMYINSLDVGSLLRDHGTDKNCMCVRSEFKDTLQKLMDSPFYKFLEFKGADEQLSLIKFLKDRNSELYAHLDPCKRTLFLRETGDNFRASKHQPTEQISFSLLNVKDLLNSPYGQHLTALWRGSETRESLDLHLKCHYEELTNIANNGIELLVNNELEQFNVIVFLCTDLGLKEKILGKCSSVSTIGCYWCTKKLSEWSNTVNSKAEHQTIKNMCEAGVQALEVLGTNPSHYTKEFKNFQMANKGQYAPPMFAGFIQETMCPCGLHLILAHHRYMWKFLFEVISKRKQDHLIPCALRSISCDYLAYQYDSYFKCKGKQYDGSSSLKMIGNDCKLIEQNILKFLNTFLQHDKGEQWNSKSFEKVRQVRSIYELFADMTTDIRSTKFDEIRARSFSKRAENFFQKLKLWAGGDSIYGKPYLHILRDHIGELMLLWGKLCGWGYGYFSCTAGEHLNKRIKIMELDNTNMDHNRFATIMKNFRIKQYYFTDQIMPSRKEITCSACHQPGHNKKNKSCPLHPSQPPLVFEESDGE